MVNYFFSPLENRAFYEKSKNMVETEEPQMTSQYGANDLHGG